MEHSIIEFAQVRYTYYDRNNKNTMKTIRLNTFYCHFIFISIVIFFM